METVELLRYARDAVLTGPDKWHKGGMTNADRTRFCALGAVEEAAERLGMKWADGIPACRALHKAVERRDPFWGIGIKSGAAKFNDWPDRKFSEVIDLFDDAIKTLEAPDRKDDK